MENNYNYQKIEDINITSKHIKTIMFKPTYPTIICLLIGVALLFINNWLVRILGIFFVIMAFLVYKFVKDRKVCDIYESGCLIYNSSDQNLVYFIDYNNIKEWEVSHDNGHDSIIFTFNDGNRTLFDTFQVNAAYAALDSVIHDKEKRVVQAKKNKEMHFEIRNPFKKWMNKK